MPVRIFNVLDVGTYAHEAACVDIIGASKISSSEMDQKMFDYIFMHGRENAVKDFKYKMK